jgi:hypothetical protein
MWGFVEETIGECRNVNLMDQEVIPDEANKSKQKWNVNKITLLRNTKITVIYQLVLPVESYLDSTSIPETWLVGRFRMHTHYLNQFTIL